MRRVAMLAALLSCAGTAEAATVITAGTPGTNGATGLYATVLAGNTTGQSDDLFTGAPDDSYLGIGSQSITYDLEGYRLVDGTGADFNIYEVDSGNVEFSIVDVLVSSDNLTFTSVKASEASVFNLAGDERHSNSAFARSYDLGGFTDIRYVRVQGLSGGAAGNDRGFDLDAMGGINFTAPPAVPEPGIWAMMIGGFGAAGSSLRRKKRRTIAFS